MKLHEYQSKDILSGFGIPVPKGGVASSPQQAGVVAQDIGGQLVVKAQVHAGGRGKAGGIKLVSSSPQAQETARFLLGKNLITHQTSQSGVPVDCVLIEEAVSDTRELYIAFTIDGSAGGVVVIASAAGGMDIEEVAETSPEKLLREPIHPFLGLQGYQSRKIAQFLNPAPKVRRPLSSLIDNLYKCFVELDCSLVEINPLVITSDDRILAIDAKITIDDDAVFRHDDLSALRDEGQEEVTELEARNAGVSYVKLDGNVGCIVNGAGLAMATMDVVSTSGAMPANFLDVGGGASEQQVAKALEIVVSDENVEKVFVNIFGGILRCDVAARGLIEGAKAIQQRNVPPMIVRMLGTNAEEGRELLSASSLDVDLVENMNEASLKIAT
ncbi:MAG: ADP-forming succinate--CoA ligase subunit beta [Chloroflexota bacterium]|nr:ADP-forming succinate--CoA ligase subunit beta [Chloroflexota bacterium]